MPPDLAVFTGRSAELKTLSALADATATTGHVPSTVLISGMPGVGKTALAVHWAHRAADRSRTANSTWTWAASTHAGPPWNPPRRYGSSSPPSECPRS
ncbi:ATP-binding protein [Streptomyces diastatochromogenes]|nr:ATP-binding protein [Streptomyces diastatochromogenes]